jgi:hypothetical protein
MPWTFSPESQRTKGTKFQSAMSMLNLYINRAGRTLARPDRARLVAARTELRRVFRQGRRRASPRASRSRAKKRAA